jgi:hypothetical protein
MFTSRILKQKPTVISEVGCPSESDLLFFHVGSRKLTVPARSIRTHLKNCRICRSRAKTVAAAFDHTLAKITARLPAVCKNA